uniref:RRM domain-containing protein n=1 Tax=Brassica oleracea var. oleracea TaxID=109376 RepID=A0A0D3DFF3_BRAOL
MAGDLFRRNRPFNQLDGFYTDWSRHLTERCLPTLRDFPTDAKNEAVLGDIHSYYDTLNHYANKNTILYFLLPSWRSNSLETPILLLGDINPRLFTSLVQSLVDDVGLSQDPIRTFSNLAAWEDLSLQLENTINGTVSRLLDETREAQDGFIRRFSDKWVSSFRGSQSETVIMETATSVTTDEEGGGAAIMEELVRIFREANQLRKSVITDIAGVLNMNQKVLFLESVCKLLSGFKHQDKAFQNSLFGYNLINQQLPPDDDNLFKPLHPSEEVNAHPNYPRPMVQNYAPPFPPDAHQFFRPFAPHQNFHPPMMEQQYAPLPPPPPPMAQHQQHAPEEDHVIYVGNLAPWATACLLYQRFSCYPSVRIAKICGDETGSYGYGFVSFADEREKTHAMKAMNRQIFLDREMYVGLAANNSI